MGGDQVAIRTESLAAADDQRCADQEPRRAGRHRRSSDVNVEDIGPTWGAEISRKALTRADRRAGRDRALHRDPVRMEDGGRRHDRPRPRRGDHGGRLRAGRARGHAGDRDRDPHDPRVLALRHGRDLRQDQGEHRVQRARRAPRVRRGRRPLAEPGADALGEHVAGRAAADPVAAAVRRRHAEGLRVRDVRRASRSARTRRSSSPRRCSRCCKMREKRYQQMEARRPGSLARRRAAGGRRGRRGRGDARARPRPRRRRASRDGSHGLAAHVRRASAARPPSASGGTTGDVAWTSNRSRR